MPHPVDIHVGSVVRVLRTAQRLSQSDLAAALGISFQQIQKYERGANRISVSKLYEMSRVLEVSPGYFFDGLNGSEPDSPTLPMGLKSIRAAQLLDEMPEGKPKAELLNLIRVLATTEPTCGQAESK